MTLNGKRVALIGGTAGIGRARRDVAAAEARLVGGGRRAQRDGGGQLI
jgi:hypothetical protein